MRKEKNRENEPHAVGEVQGFDASFALQLSQLFSWISDYKTLYKMIPYLKNREFAVLEPKFCGHEIGRDTRYLKAHNIQSIQFILFDMLKFHERQTLYNLYYSTIKYAEGIPNMTPDLSKRDTTDWKENYWQHIKEVDFFLDIDAPSHEDIEIAKDDTLRIVRDFPENMVYEIRFTGCGFHIVIPQQEMMMHYKIKAESCEPFKAGNIWDEYTKVAENFSEKYSELIDTRLNDSKRIIKLPHSLAFYPDGKTFVCCPISLRDLTNFRLDNYTYQRFEHG